jgi:proteasome lid subunit RPN8/RPN11
MIIPPNDCLLQIKDYLLVDPMVERGCLVTSDYQIIPFENIAAYPAALIKMGPEDFGVMADLVRDNRLLGWAHSHPCWLPYPSFIDINMHQLPVQMIIYSITDDSFGIYTTDEIIAMEEYYIELASEPKNIEPTLWKPKVLQLHSNKELIKCI